MDGTRADDVDKSQRRSKPSKGKGRSHGTASSRVAHLQQVDRTDDPVTTSASAQAAGMTGKAGTKLCKFWKEGTCRRGDSCTFGHCDELLVKTGTVNVVGSPMKLKVSIISLLWSDPLRYCS